MSVSSLLIRRPVATCLLAAALTLAGCLAYIQLPVSSLPQVDFPTIRVSAGLPGASPEVMAASVATPLEKQLSHVSGVTEMTSRSSTGNATVVLQFDLDKDINSAAREVQAALNAASPYLPANLPSRPRYRKINPADSPILVLSLTSQVVPRHELYDIASSIFAQRLSQVEGVGQVSVGGSSLPAVRVELDPQPVARYQIGLNQVARVLQGANANGPKGSLTGPFREFPIYTSDQLFKAKDYKDLVVVYRNRAPVRISDLGEVTDSTEDLRNYGTSQGKPAVMIWVHREPAANIIETVDRIKALLPHFRASLPPNVNIHVDNDRTLTVRASVTEAQQTMVIAVSLVIFVVFVFLRNGRATLIPAISVPVSLIATFAVMRLANYSLDNLSLMALTVATGFVVDDVVVVLENITRYVEAGMRPMQAAIKGASEIGFTVLSMSASLIAVFIPILMMGGVVGRLFREFAVVLSVAIAMSLLVSLTLTPVMASRLLKTQHRHGWLYNRTEALFNAFLSSYGAALRAVLNHRALVLSVMLATVAASVYLYIAIPKGFFPPQDTGRLSGNIEGDESISYQALLDKALVIEKQVRQDPDVETVSMVAGASGGGGGSANQARLWIQLKPREERDSSADAIIDRLRRKTSNVVGATPYLQANQDLRVGGRSSNAEYQYTLQGPDFAALRTWGPRMAERLAKLPQIADVSSDQQDSGLSANVIINHDAAARLGLTTQAIDTALYSAFGQRQVSVMYKSINQYHVVLGLDQRWQQGPQFLRQMYLQTPRGVSVPLSSFARFTQGTTPLSLPHEGQFPATTISFNLRPGASLSEAVDAINAAGIDMGLPANITGRFAGTARAFQESLSSQPMLVLTAFIAVYVMLGMLYESLIHPLTILSTLPSAGLGALVALVLTRTDLTIMALIGIILLIGIVQKNAIMMVDFALAAERDEGLTPVEAIYKASLLRFRPITMTTCAALLGAVPLAFASGTGSELRQPLGIAIIGGLAVSHMLTLFTTPVIYLVLDRLHLRLTRRKPRPRYSPGLTAVRP